ncbi:alpha/beta hydrolase-fold protein [Dyadobacter pollutisoli]|uniref:Alpha/beta hydrolase-fold protein n=1 Tax=Dyadobacter pollutisoli TaxID=2910158 RepID=A0A9E8SJV2_9BACT|nr:alpha/beta hydrolase-fold protein [Dyadobacter pollutisoli]WAC10126.1 alpha/beta hydrolase-fold protein [Dyadobacter pollutisoli]
MKLIVIIFLLFAPFVTATAQQFKVTYTSSAFKGPFSGNVILYLSPKNEQPKNHSGWPVYRMPVDHIEPNEPIIFSDSSLSYPTLLSRLQRGEYYMQVVWDLNRDGRVIGRSTGNVFSAVQKIRLNDPDEIFTVVCDQLVPEPVFTESKFVKHLNAPSALLSKFHKKPVALKGAVILPSQYYEEPDRRFPVYFMVGGFGGDHYHYSSTVSSDTMPSVPLDTMAVIKVFLDGDCSLGHSTYANSDNNGPVGDAFATEMIPWLDQKFRTNGGRVIRGHSSGGWTVVYLLTHYPQLFAGGNASAPDAVDFHRFTKTNLYTDTSRIEFVDALTIGKKPDIEVIYDRPNIAHSIEDIIYRGEQNVSFDAVFGPKGKNGLPRPLYNSATGKLDKEVFEHWKRYDLTQYVIRNWPRLEKDLAGKLRVSVGNEDNAFLNISAMLMEAEMKKIGADIRFDYYPGNHFTVVTREYRKDEDMWLKKCYLEWLARRK